MSYYEEVELEDLDFTPLTQTYTYPCPCGDKFQISLQDMYDGEDIATCPSCTLRVRVVFQEGDLPELREEEEEEEEEEGTRRKEEMASSDRINAEVSRLVPTMSSPEQPEHGQPGFPAKATMPAATVAVFLRLSATVSIFLLTTPFLSVGVFCHDLLSSISALFGCS